MKFFGGLYNSSYNYVKECSSIVRYLNKLILKGGVKRVSLLLAISIDSNHMIFFFFFFFFHACRSIRRVGLEDGGGYS